MKNILLIFILLFNADLMYSQEEEVTPELSKKILRMGGAGGFTTYVLLWNVDNINAAIKSDVSPTLKNQPLILYGGEGYGYIMLIENFRIGGLGAGGDVKRSTVIGNTRIDLETNVSFGGITINYVLPVTQKLDFTIGSIIGWGGIDLKLRRDNWGIKRWDDILNQWGTNGLVSVSNFSHKINSSFFVYQPNLKIEYAILRWLSVRLSVGYMGMTGGKWKLDDEFELIGVPDKLNASGFIFDTGIFIGTFIF